MTDIFDILDEVTSDDFVDRTGNDYFYQLHADIITDNFEGDWSWSKAIKFWSPTDIEQARLAYEEAAR
jgi:hypothetical protein